MNLSKQNTVTSLGIVTSDRTLELQRCIQSYIANALRHERSINFVVVDDSRNYKTRTINKQMLNAIRSTFSVNIHYAGLEEKVEFANLLSKEGDCPSEVIDFALFDTYSLGYTDGANRNALLLHSVGELLVSVDDDTICEISQSPSFREGLSLTPNHTFSEHWSFPTYDVAKQSVTFVDRDFISLHEHLLGKLINNFNAGVSTTDSIRNIQDPSSSILLTFNGILGDCGQYAPTWWWGVSGRSRHRLLESEEYYRSAFSSRQVLRAIDGLTISNSPWCMTTAIGYDNRSLLPCFMPLLRNVDGIFGLTLKRCFTSGQAGYLPWSILHSPSEPRYFTYSDVWVKSIKRRMSDIILACIGSFTVGQTLSNKDKLQSLGKQLEFLGLASMTEFQDYICMQLRNMVSGYINFLQDQLFTIGTKYSFMRRDIYLYIDLLKDQLESEDFIVPYDLAQKIDPSKVMSTCKLLIYRLGQLFYWWPHIIETVKRLKSREVTIGIPI